MIRFVGGKQRGGKSLLAVLRLVDELRGSNRFIVTNLALMLEPWVDGAGKPRKGLVRSLVDKYGQDFDCRNRIVFLENADVRRFYMCRPYVDKETERVVVEWLQPESDRKFRLSGKRGVAYFIDEAHVFFPAHEWEKIRDEALSWATQAWRAGDDVYFLSQVIGNVAKPLRGQAQECIWLTNHVHLQLGPFRQPDVIRMKVFQTTPPAPSEEPLSSGRLTYDREWTRGLYDTAKGVGVSGVQADIGQRAKGLHWSWLVAFAAAFCVVVFVVYKGMVGGFRSFVRGFSGSAEKAVASAVSTVVPVKTNTELPVRIVTNTFVVKAEPVIVPPLPSLKGLVRGEKIVCFLDDGTMFEALSAVDIPQGVLVDGRTFRWASRTNR